jgi:hypothetical protein
VGATDKGVIRYRAGDSNFEIVDESKLDDCQKHGLHIGASTVEAQRDAAVIVAQKIKEALV